MTSISEALQWVWLASTELKDTYWLCPCTCLLSLFPVQILLYWSRGFFFFFFFPPPRQGRPFPVVSETCESWKPVLLLKTEVRKTECIVLFCVLHCKLPCVVQQQPHVFPTLFYQCPSCPSLHGTQLQDFQPHSCIFKLCFCVPPVSPSTSSSLLEWHTAVAQRCVNEFSYTNKIQKE